jgi:hypothetical protein
MDQEKCYAVRLPTSVFAAHLFTITIRHNSGDHRPRHHSKHTARPPRNHRSPTPVPINRAYQHTYQHSRSPLRRQYSYTRESAAVAGPSREVVDDVDDAYDSEMYSDY